MRDLEGHGVLGEEVLALGSLGNDASEGLEGDGTDGDEGGEEEEHGGTERSVATLLLRCRHFREEK